MTALYVASQNGHVEVVNILLQNGTHVDVPEEVSFCIFLQKLTSLCSLSSVTESNVYNYYIFDSFL